MNDGHDESTTIHHARAISRGGKLLIEEPPLQILPSLAVAIGLNEAIFLQQLHYWVRMSSHVHNGRRWVYNSLADWRQQFPFWSDRTLRRVIKSLESPRPGYSRALLVSTLELNTHPMDKTKWYTLDYDLVDELSAPTDSVETSRASRRCGQIDRIVETDPTSRCGHSGHIEGPWRASPFGQFGRIEDSDWPTPSGQFGRIEGPEWPAPNGQNGRFSLQRLPETTDKTPTPCALAHEKTEGEAAFISDAPSPDATRSLTAASDSPSTVATPYAIALDPADTLDHQAAALVQAFHQRFHGGMAQTPHRAELAHAIALLQKHGPGFASFFLRYAQQTVRHEGRTVHVFGGIMRYEASALAAYRRQAGQTAAQQAESGALQQRRQLDAYEAWLRPRLDALKETLSPAELDALRKQAGRQVGRRHLPPYLLARQIEHEVETQLMQVHDVPSFEVWSAQHES